MHNGYRSTGRRKAGDDLRPEGGDLRREGKVVLAEARRCRFRRRKLGRHLCEFRGEGLDVVVKLKGGCLAARALLLRHEVGCVFDIGRSSEGATGGAKRRLHDVVASRPVLVIRINRWERLTPSSFHPPALVGGANLNVIIRHAFMEFIGLALLRGISVVRLARILHKEKEPGRE